MFMIPTLSLLQGFFFRESVFYFCQFLSNFFRYSSSNFLSFYPYNIFAIYFSSSSPLLKSLSSTKSNFSCYLTSVFIHFSNSAITSFIFSKSFSFFYELYFTINFFQCNISSISQLPLFFFYLIFFQPSIPQLLLLLLVLPFLPFVSLLAFCIILLY